MDPLTQAGLRAIRVGIALNVVNLAIVAVGRWIGWAG
jgi:hypothetical protein